MRWGGEPSLSQHQHPVVTLHDATRGNSMQEGVGWWAERGRGLGARLRAFVCDLGVGDVRACMCGMCDGGLDGALVSGW